MKRKVTKTVHACDQCGGEYDRPEPFLRKRPCGHVLCPGCRYCKACGEDTAAALRQKRIKERAAEVEDSESYVEAADWRDEYTGRHALIACRICGAAIYFDAEAYVDGFDAVSAHDAWHTKHDRERERA